MGNVDQGLADIRSGLELLGRIIYGPQGTEVPGFVYSNLVAVYEVAYEGLLEVENGSGY